MRFRQVWRKVSQWWHVHEGWVAIIVLAISVFAIGFAVATVRAEMLAANIVRQKALSTQHIADAYREALQSKDETIAALSAHAVTATQTANAAVKKADHAVTVATDTATVCKEKP